MAAKKAASKAALKKAATPKAAPKAPAKAAAAAKPVAKPATAAKPIVKRTQAPAAQAASNVATLSGVALELATAAKTQPKAGELFTGQGGFADRLMEDLAKVDQAEFDKLSAEGRTWFDATVDVINAAKYDEIAQLDGYTAAEDGSGGVPGVSANAAVNASNAANNTPVGGAPAVAVPPQKPAKTPKEPKAAKTPKEPKAAKTPKAPKEPRGPRMGLLIAEMVAKNPKLSFDQLKAKLDVDGEKGGKKIDSSEGSYIFARWQEAKHCVATFAAK